jgi:hypothetical protein
MCFTCDGFRGGMVSREQGIWTEADRNELFLPNAICLDSSCLDPREDSVPLVEIETVSPFFYFLFINSFVTLTNLLAIR